MLISVAVRGVKASGITILHGYVLPGVFRAVVYIKSQQASLNDRASYSSSPRHLSPDKAPDVFNFRFTVFRRLLVLGYRFGCSMR